ncbi:vacuolar ATP synthase subunit e [Culex quinquefasciatus]|uniref:Vacuolar ATP synthase subunit e n=1 Tax=Culex quinquefasciatus TaxID=7176 RepID=B0X6N8_CULQU|nr:vacuolar ATP synthase subunit e [Culex quinquefasciatus]|eukprot:XP_001865310.1 vacuolar ATP synthase subunit e [Culex quinquefasciatus]
MADMIQPHDKPVLTHLTKVDIVCKTDPMSYVIESHFSLYETVSVAPSTNEPFNMKGFNVAKRLVLEPAQVQDDDKNVAILYYTGEVMDEDDDGEEEDERPQPAKNQKHRGCHGGGGGKYSEVDQAQNGHGHYLAGGQRECERDRRQGQGGVQHLKGPLIMENYEKKGKVEPQKKSEFSNMLNKAHLKLQKVPENHFAGMLEEFSTRDPSLHSEVISKGLLQITDAQLMQNVPASVEQSQKTSG